MSARPKLSPQIIALTGVLSAAALVFLYAASVIPSGWMGVTAISGLIVAVAVSTAGYFSGILCYLVSGLLGLLLVPAKQVAVLFLCLFGLYPLLKNKLERIKIRILEYILKLVYFNLIFAIIYFLLYGLFFQGIDAELAWNVPYVVVILVGSLIFLLYDYAFSKVMSLLQARLVPQLQRMFHRS